MSRPSRSLRVAVATLIAGSVLPMVGMAATPVAANNCMKALVTKMSAPVKVTNSYMVWPGAGKVDRSSFIVTAKSARTGSAIASATCVVDGAGEVVELQMDDSTTMAMAK